MRWRPQPNKYSEIFFMSESVVKRRARQTGTENNRSFASVERLLKKLEVSVPGYPRDLAVLVRLAAHIEKKMIEASNAMLKPHGLNYTMYQVLVISLGSGDVAPTLRDLAGATGERATNMTHLCDELEARDLLQRQRDTRDRRRTYIVLTAAGRKLLAKLQPQMWEIWRSRFQGITAAQRKQLLELMRLQYRNIGGN
jgi:MarR family transcriptional repressor of emrRAB